MNTLLLLLIAVLLVGWLVYRRRQSRLPKVKMRPERRQAAVTSKTSTKYHAVSIQFPSNACDAAREIAGKRYLSNEAPSIPLPDCDGRACTCTFIHYDDRRTGKDRRSPFTPAGFGSSTGSWETERREGRDRRGGKIDLEL